MGITILVAQLFYRKLDIINSISFSACQEIAVPGVIFALFASVSGAGTSSAANHSVWQSALPPYLAAVSNC